MVPFASKEEIVRALSYPHLIDCIKSAFAKNSAVTPLRHHHDYKNPPGEKDSTLLLMPSWIPGEDLGVKIVTISPENTKRDLPSIHGVYLLFDAKTGAPKLLLDAKTLTTLRTAATSALASSFLSRENCSNMLMIGTGAMAPELIRAHASVRPIENVFVWGRDFNKARTLCEDLAKEKIKLKAVVDLAEGIEQADIISCATLSESPLIFGKNLRAGQHIDLVGAYRPHMREADNETIKRSRVFVDHYPGALHETGDIVIPIKEGTIRESDLKADLHELCSRKKDGRSNDKEITLFKSVGHALEDLTAAQMVFSYLEKNKN